MLKIASKTSSAICMNIQNYCEQNRHHSRSIKHASGTCAVMQCVLASAELIRNTFVFGRCTFFNSALKGREKLVKLALKFNSKFQHWHNFPIPRCMLLFWANHRPTPLPPMVWLGKKFCSANSSENPNHNISPFRRGFQFADTPSLSVALTLIPKCRVCSHIRVECSICEPCVLQMFAFYILNSSLELVWCPNRMSIKNWNEISPF